MRLWPNNGCVHRCPPLIPGIRTGPRKSDWIRYDEDAVRHALARTNDSCYVLTGRVDHTNDILRLVLRLYERELDQPLWVQTFDGTTNDVIALERQAIHQVVHQLGREISDIARSRMGQVLTNNLAAYGLFLEGWAHHLLGTKIGLTEALAY